MKRQITNLIKTDMGVKCTYTCQGICSETEYTYKEIALGVYRKDDWDDESSKQIEESVTYDVYFHDDNDSNNKGFSMSYDDCMHYIKANNDTNESYFADYKGGIVCIYCNEAEMDVYSEEVR